MNRMQIVKLLNSVGAVLIPLNDKMPIPKGWQQLTESHPEALNPDSDKNIGVVLGLASNGLVDIDIDDMGALALADVFLPKTGMEFGRKSKPRSHRIYRCQGAGKTKRLQGRNGVIVELRGNPWTRQRSGQPIPATLRRLLSFAGSEDSSTWYARRTTFHSRGSGGGPQRNA